MSYMWEPRWGEMTPLAARVMRNDLKRQQAKHGKAAEFMNAAKRKKPAVPEGNDLWKQLGQERVANGSR